MTVARRLAATGAGALVLLTLAPPASAGGHSLTLSRPDGEPPNFQETVDFEGQQAILVKGTISAEHPIEEVEFEPIDVGEGPCQGEVVKEPEFTFDEDDQAMTGTFELVVTAPCNRTTDVKATINHRPLALSVGAPPPAPVEGAFSVAIPPAQVQGLTTTYDAPTREVRLQWAPNPEPDLIRYYIESDPSGRDPISRIGEVPAGETSFVHRDVGQEHRYQVIAVRAGPTPDSQIAGEPSRRRSAGPQPSGVAVAPSNRDTSGGNRSGDSSGASRPPSRTRTTADTGFDQALPFDPSQTTIPSGDPQAGDPSGDAAVLAEFDDAVSDDERRATLVPVAAGLALIVGSLHLFLLSRRVGESDIPIVPR